MFENCSAKLRIKCPMDIRGKRGNQRGKAVTWRGNVEMKKYKREEEKSGRRHPHTRNLEVVWRYSLSRLKSRWGEELRCGFNAGITAPAADRRPWLPLVSRGRGGGKEETIYRRGEEGNDSEFDSTCRHSTKTTYYCNRSTTIDLSVTATQTFPSPIPFN